MNHTPGFRFKDRDATALRALEIFEKSSGKSKTTKYMDVEAELDVANPTARNLVTTGRRLRDGEQNSV